MLNSIRFSYAFRTGTLSGAAALYLVHVTARSTADHIAAWEKQQELRAGQWIRTTTRSSRRMGAPHSGASCVFRRVAGPAIVSRSFARACDAVNLADTLFVDDGAGGCFIHGWPPAARAVHRRTARNERGHQCRRPHRHADDHRLIATRTSKPAARCCYSRFRSCFAAAIRRTFSSYDSATS